MLNIALSEKYFNTKSAEIGKKFLDKCQTRHYDEIKNYHNHMVPKEERKMYFNLEAEMVRSGLKNEDLAKAIKRDERTVRNKRSGTTEFTLNETFIIRDTFFPKLSLEYLFEKTEHTEEV